MTAVGATVVAQPKSTHKEKVSMFNFEPFLSRLQVSEASPKTIRAYRNDLKLFEAFAHEQSISEAMQIDHAVVQTYIGWMRKKKNSRTGKPGLAPTSIARRLAALSSFLEYTRATEDHNLRNPFKGLSNKWQ